MKKDEGRRKLDFGTNYKEWYKHKKGPLGATDIVTRGFNPWIIRPIGKGESAIRHDGYRRYIVWGANRMGKRSPFDGICPLR